VDDELLRSKEVPRILRLSVKNLEMVEGQVNQCADLLPALKSKLSAVKLPTGKLRHPKS